MSDHAEQPGLADAPEPLAKERFSLSWRDGIVLLLGATVIAFTLPHQKCWSEPWEQLLPHVVGLFLGLVLVSMVPAVLMFYICRRSRTAASITFLIFVVLCAAGQVERVARERAKTYDGGILTKRISPKLQQWLRDQLDPYQKVCNEVLKDSPMSPGWVKEKADVVRARKMIDRARAANRELRGLYSRVTPFVLKELAAEGVPEQDQAGLVAAAVEGFTRTEKVFAAMRDKDDAMLTGYRRACDLLIDHWGHWHYDAKADTVIFDEDRARDEFAAIAVRLTEIIQTFEHDAAEFRRAMQGGK